MTEPFTPLLPQADAPSQPGQPAASPAPKAAFVPFGTVAQPSRTLPASPAPSSSNPAPFVGPANHAPQAPTVTLKREGDRIVQIQIRCACGESISLDCQY